jgi:hypothetical protein
MNIIISFYMTSHSKHKYALLQAMNVVQNTMTLKKVFLTYY